MITNDYTLIFLGVSALGILLIGIRILYFKHKSSHLRLRLAVSESIGELIAEMNKKSTLSKAQRDYFKTILNLAESKSMVRSYLWNFIIKGSKEESLSFLLSYLGIKEEDKLFNDATVFLTLCALQASTYNFFLGGIFRKTMLGDYLQYSKLVKIAIQQKGFVKRPDALAAFGDIAKTA